MPWPCPLPQGGFPQHQLQLSPPTPLSGSRKPHEDPMCTKDLSGTLSLKLPAGHGAVEDGGREPERASVTPTPLLASSLPAGWCPQLRMQTLTPLG